MIPPQESINEAVSAFISFQYNESFARCIEDHHSFSLWYPSKLKFRGKHKLTVKKAWEPDQIIWENLEVPFTSKVLKRLRTFLISFFIIVAGFALIVAASIYKTQFLAKTDIPSPNTCDSVIPSLFANSSNANVYNQNMIRSPTLVDNDYMNIF